MMEAKDTVEQFSWATEDEARIQNARLLRQAEISFKAGYKEGENQQLQNAFGAGRKAGIKEVVEWIKAQQYECENPEDMAYHWLLIPPEDWQAKLKEWDIELLKEMR